MGATRGTHEATLEDTAERDERRPEPARKEPARSVIDGSVRASLREDIGGPDDEIDLDDGQTPFETVDSDLFELIQLGSSSPRNSARVPPPPTRAEIDLDALVRDAASTATPLLEPLALSHAPRAPEAGSRSKWGIAIVVATTAIVAGTASALTMSFLTDAPAPTPAPTEPIAERTLLAATVEAASPAPAPSASPPAAEPADAPPLARADERPPETEAPAPPIASSVRPERPRARARSRRPAPAPARPSNPESDSTPTREAREAPAPRAEAVVAAPTAAEASDEQAADALPEHPSRAHVDAAVRAILPALRTCGQGTDLITLELHFASNGHATTGQVDARHLSPTQRSCIARAARAARVPPFSAPHLSVRYPVRL